MKQETSRKWLERFPALAAIDDTAWRRAVDCAEQMRIPAGTVLFRNGDRARGFVMVIDGSVRVQKMDPDGHEIVLYRVEEGQNCMLTTTCLLGGQHYPCEGIAETEVEMVLLPEQPFQQALDGSAAFRRFVMAGIGTRISDLMALIEDVAFGRMDRRLAALLRARSNNGAEQIIATHQELAVELGTAREVVSRVLKHFERRNLIRLGRGIITVTDPNTLNSL